MMLAPVLAIFTSVRFWAYLAMSATAAWVLWSAYDWAFDRGVDATNEVWLERYTKEQQDWQSATLLAEQRARAAEWQGTQRVAALTEEYKRKERNYEQTTATLRARIAAGERLRDPYPSDRKACGDTGATAPGAASGDTGERGTELSREATEFLSDEATRADGIVEKYNLCVDTIAAYIDFYGGGYGWRID